MTCSSELLVRAHESEQPPPDETTIVRIGFPFTDTDGVDVTKDDANYPHACLCKREGCALRDICAFYHHGRKEWTV